MSEPRHGTDGIVRIKRMPTQTGGPPQAASGRVPCALEAGSGCPRREGGFAERARWQPGPAAREPAAKPGANPAARARTLTQNIADSEVWLMDAYR